MKKYKRYFLLQVLIPLFLFLFLILNIYSCSGKKFVGKTIRELKNTKGEPDYSNLYYWASHPWKEDPADKIPLPLKIRGKDSIADVFFIHPTTYTEGNMNMGWNAELNNEFLNKKTDNSTILYQASVFNEQSRIFAPRYRQAHIKAFYTTDKSKVKAFDLAYSDIKSAFVFYLKNYHHGQPVIIASHSQGTLHAAKLLKEYFESKPLQNQLVCGYLLGLPVFADFFNEIKPCEDSTSTGCLVSWRTFKNGYEPLFVKVEKKAIVTNPLTWTLSPGLAPASLNKGGIIKKFDRIIPGVVNAQVHGNILWTNTPKFFGNILLTTKNYHIGDINLFYVNIRDNVRTRIRSFLKREW